jgi:hypothetical protein
MKTWRHGDIDTKKYETWEWKHGKIETWTGRHGHGDMEMYTWTSKNAGQFLSP